MSSHLKIPLHKENRQFEKRNGGVRILKWKPLEVRKTLLVPARLWNKFYQHRLTLLYEMSDTCSQNMTGKLPKRNDGCKVWGFKKELQWQSGRAMVSCSESPNWRGCAGSWKCSRFADKTEMVIQDAWTKLDELQCILAQWVSDILQNASKGTASTKFLILCYLEDGGPPVCQPMRLLMPN